MNSFLVKADLRKKEGVVNNSMYTKNFNHAIVYTIKRSKAKNYMLDFLYTSLQYGKKCL